MLAAALLVGCSSDPTHASLGLADGVDAEPWQYAIGEWRRASGGRVTLRITDIDDADVSIAFSSFAPSTACAYTDAWRAEIRIQINEPELCVGAWHSTATHEIGHWLGADDSTDPRDVMYGGASTVEVLTAHDVAMALEGAN